MLRVRTLLRVLNCSRSYSVFLMIIFRMWNFLDLVSDFPTEQMAVVLRSEREKIKDVYTV